MKFKFSFKQLNFSVFKSWRFHNKCWKLFFFLMAQRLALFLLLLEIFYTQRSWKSITVKLLWREKQHLTQATQYFLHLRCSCYNPSSACWLFVYTLLCFYCPFYVLPFVYHLNDGWKDSLVDAFSILQNTSAKQWKNNGRKDFMEKNILEWYQNCAEASNWFIFCCFCCWS